MRERHNRRAWQRGFTLVELMIVVVIAAILLGIAVPGARDVLIRNRMTAKLNEMVGAVQAARSEAVKNNQNVVLCRSADGTDCDGAGWEDGWIVWLDGDADGTVDADEVLLEGGPADQFTFGGLAVASVTFRPDGTPSSTGTLRLCYGSQLEGELTLDVTGRPSSKKIYPPVNCP